MNRTQLINDNNRPANNQYVLNDTENKIVSFLSYQSLIADIDKGKKEIRIYPDYKRSTTTTKHRNIFFRRNRLDGLDTTKDLDKAIKEGEFGEYKILKMEKQVYA